MIMRVFSITTDIHDSRPCHLRFMSPRSEWRAWRKRGKRHLWDLPHRRARGFVAPHLSRGLYTGVPIRYRSATAPGPVRRPVPLCLRCWLTLPKGRPATSLEARAPRLAPPPNVARVKVRFTPEGAESQHRCGRCTPPSVSVLRSEPGRGATIRCQPSC